MRFQRNFATFQHGILELFNKFFAVYEPIITNELQEIVRSIEDQNNAECTIADVATKSKRWQLFPKQKNFSTRFENRLTFGWDTSLLLPLGMYQINPTPYTFFIDTDEKRYIRLLPTLGWKKI